jgi:hypothetical protein
MRAIDPWFNIGAEGISPLAEMSVVHRTEVLSNLAKDVMALPEGIAISSKLREISRNRNRLSGLYDMVNVTDDGLYKIQDILNATIIDDSVDAVRHKDVLDIYGKLRGKTRSGATDLIKSGELKDRLLELSPNKRVLLIDMIKSPQVRGVVESFFLDVETKVITELDLIRVSEISPLGIRLFGNMPTLKINKFTIGPDGKFYAAPKEEVIMLWKKMHPRVDESKFVSVEIDIGGNEKINPEFIKWMEDVNPRFGGAKTSYVADIKRRKAAMDTKPMQYIGHPEYIIRTSEGDRIYKNKASVEQAIGSIRGISPWSTRDQLKDLATSGITKIGQDKPNIYGPKYDEAINKIEQAIKKAVNNADIGDDRPSDIKVEQIANVARIHAMDVLSPIGEYKDVHGPIIQFMGEYTNSDLFLSRVRLTITQKMNM